MGGFEANLTASYLGIQSPRSKLVPGPHHSDGVYTFAGIPNAWMLGCGQMQHSQGIKWLSFSHALNLLRVGSSSFTRYPLQ